MIADLGATNWKGRAELWLDPLGDEVVCSDCAMVVTEAGLEYTWRHGEKAQQGKLALTPAGADFSDSFHSPQVMKCRHRAGGWGILQVEGRYGPDADWGWRIGLSLRAPSGELVFQMTNIAPWGEEVRAVRMVCSPE